MNRAMYTFAALTVSLVLLGAGCTPTNQNPPADQRGANNNPPANNAVDPAYVGWHDYTNNADGYTIKYPADWSLTEGSKTPPPFGEYPAVKLGIPQSYFTGTNLASESSIYVYKGCLLEGTENATVVMHQVGENRFKEYKVSDAGAGNFYESNILSVQSGTYCYNIMIFLHSLNTANFGPGTVVTQYDRKGLTDIAYKVAGSLEIVSR